MKVLYGFLFVDDNNNKIKLTEEEYLVLKCLSTHEISSYALLSNTINKTMWGYKKKDNRKIAVVLCRLRKKLDGIIKIKVANKIGYYLDKEYNISFEELKNEHN